MITLSLFKYKNQETKISLHPPLGNKMTKLKQIKGFGYSATHKTWYVSFSDKVISQLKKIDKIKMLNFSEKRISSPQEKINITINKTEKIIIINHKNNLQIWNNFKSIETSYWQKEKKQWLFKGDNKIYKEILTICKKNDYIIQTKYEKSLLEKEENQIVRTYIESLLLKNYSLLTIESYKPYFKKFVNNFVGFDLKSLKLYQIKNYVELEIANKNLSETQSKHLMSAIKFFYEKILGREKIYFKLSKKQIDISKIKISYTSLKPLLDKITKLDDKLLVILHFAYGMQKDTLSQLTLKQLKSIIYTDNSISNLLKIISINYYTNNLPKVFVFEDSENKQITSFDIQKKIIDTIKTYQLYKIYKLHYLAALEQTNFVEQTKKNYVSGFLSFLKFHDFVHPVEISAEKIKDYLFNLKDKQKLSSSYISNQINTISFYYNNILEIKIERRFLLRPKREKKLPTVLSLSEITRMITNTTNIKHKNIIALLYSSGLRRAGLRRAELLNLKVNDIDFERNVIVVKAGKGNKDRQTELFI